jgi:NADPH-dependent curcumin reductase CurA
VSAAPLTRRWIVARRPLGRATADLFELIDGPTPGIADGQFLVRLLWIGTDVGPVSRLRDGGNYAPPIELGEVMPSNGVAEVVASRHPQVAVGDLFSGPFGWTEYAVRDTPDGLFAVDPSRPVSFALGLLGLQGLTAYVGLLEIGALRAGETVVISAAAGATGLIAGQLAALRGARAVGIAGGVVKARAVVDDFGFAAGVDRHAPDAAAALADACPDGADLYFDNVGGDLQDTVLPLLNVFGRHIVCGRVALAGLSDVRLDTGTRDYNVVLVKRLRKQGFLVYDHLDRWPMVREELWRWHEEGRLTLPEHVAEGFEALPDAFTGMLDGANLGRSLVHVADRITD